MAQARRGDRAAFAELIVRHQRAVYAVALAVTGDDDVARDVAQDAFVTAWCRLRSLHDDGRFRGWLCTIARNAARDRLRAKQGKRVDALVEDAVPDPGDAPEARLQAEQEADLVHASLSRLPAKLREALVLFYFEDCSTPQVAAALGIGVAAAEQRLRRGRRQMHARLETLARAHFGRRAAKIALVAGVLGRLDGASAATTVVRPVPWLAATCGGLALLTLGCVAGLVLHGESDIAAPRGNVDVAQEAVVHAEASPRATSRAAAFVPETPGDWIDRMARRQIEEAAAAPVTPFTVTAVSWGHAVALDGEPVLEEEPPSIHGRLEPTVEVRVVTGRVVGRDGKGVANAIVLADAIWNPFSMLLGSESATTDAQGRFSIEVGRARVSLMAVRSREQWSSTVAVPAGDEPVTGVLLEVDAAARITGVMTRAGEPERPMVVATVQGEAKSIVYGEGEDDGTFGELLVPAGAVSVVVTPSDEAEEHGFVGGAAARELVLQPGEHVHLEIDLEPGELLVVSHAWIPEASEYGNGLTHVLPGHVAPASEAEIRAMLSRGDTRFAFSAPATHFEDTVPGDYTVCVSCNGPQPTVCKAVTIDETKDVFEVTFDEGEYVCDTKRRE